MNQFTILGILGSILTYAMIIWLNGEYAFAQENNTKVVHAGEGNASAVIAAFVPSNVEINVGDSVQWISPIKVGEPHSVTFLSDEKYFAEFASPFQVPNSTDFVPSMPDSNAEPVIPPSEPGQTDKTVIAVNARAVMPSVVDSSGKEVTYLPPNSTYVMNGTETYVNSGWLWPEGQAPPGGPPLSEFTITFDKAGTYPYLCNVHPWMTGSVTVK